jgi:MshEN domain
VRRNRAAGDQIDEERAVEERPRPPAALTPAPTREEEAELIAERLAALVASRKASGEPAPAPPKLASRNDRPPRAKAPSESDPAAHAGVEGARHSGRLLGNLLVTRGFVHESELQYALSLQAESGHPIGQILVALGLISEDDLVELLAEQRRMKVMDPARAVCDAEMLARLPKADAHRLCALPIRLTDGKIDVVIADPSNGNAVTELMNLLGGRLRLFLATRAAIDAAIDRVYA